MVTRKLAYLGPAGTFSEEAGLLYAPEAQHLAFPSISAAAKAVESYTADEAIVPIENSLQGSVTETLDLLIHESRLVIRQEMVMPIELYLVARPGTKIDAVKVIHSHPQPLGQCRLFLERCFPKAQRMASLSTTAAVEDVLASSVPAVALTTRRATQLYPVEVLAKAVQDYAQNMTRFVVLAHHDHEPTGADKTSICFAFDKDAPGLLWGVLGEFARRDINLSKVESRPSRESLGRYVFLVDLDRHREEADAKAALEGVGRLASTLKIIGSYPRFRANS